MSECLGKIKGAGTSKRDAEKALLNAALDQFAIPGEPAFPLNQAYEAPRDRADAETLRGYVFFLFSFLHFRWAIHSACLFVYLFIFLCSRWVLGLLCAEMICLDCSTDELGLFLIGISRRSGKNWQ